MGPFLNLSWWFQLTPLTPDEIPLMREVCVLAANTLVYLGKNLQAGQSTEELDRLAYEYIMDHQAVPAPLNYKGFPKSICTSVNDCICHGVPSSSEILKEGDTINIDVTCVKNGFYGDTSRTFFVGEVSDQAKKLTQCAWDSMMKGIEAIRPLGHVGDIGFAIHKCVSRKGFYPVQNIGGHGIGKVFHEEPFVPSFGKKGKGDVLEPWACITVEPMINETPEPIREFDIPGSEIKYYHTSDKSLSAQFEHTILINDEAYEILTVPSEAA